MGIRDTFGLPLLTLELIADEGKRSSIYVDTEGHASVGIGHNIGARSLTPVEVALFKSGTIPHRTLTDQEIMALFYTDVGICVDALDLNAAWFRTLPEARQRVMINLTFNLGWHGLAQFRRFLAAMQIADWAEAGRQLVDSHWYHQVGLRGPRMVARVTQTGGEIA